MNTADLNKVWEIKTLTRKDKQDEAKAILNRIAKQVQPIMRRHNWRVKLLSEFCPKNPALLGVNVNHGVNVKLRLRRPNRDSEFYPFHQILDTMLHELCHNAHGPHNAVFYKLWDDLRKECEDLMNKGISGSGQGFDLPGRRLGGFSQPAVSSLRHTALNAAQKRARLGSLLPSGPKRLGGDSSLMTALSPVQAAAMAAERRLQDELWCASGSCEIEEAETSNDLLQKQMDRGSGTSRNSTGFDVNKSTSISGKRSRDMSNINTNALSRDTPMEPDFLDSTPDGIVSGSVVCENDTSQNRSDQRKKSFKSFDFQNKSNFINLSNDSSASASTNYQDATKYAANSCKWECGVCTLANPPLAPVCEVCGTLKPRDLKDKYKIWSCKFCTLENSVDLEKCMACNEWRYSHGAPVAAPALNIGT
ncbi:hypothetical protein ACET3Z_017870 [Daucus carota]